MGRSGDRGIKNGLGINIHEMGESMVEFAFS